MAQIKKTPFFRLDDNEFVGFIAHDGTTWQALTIFGYQISRESTESAAERVLNEEGLTFLTGIWQYYDTDDKEWFPCVIKEAYEQRVIVNRTNVFGYKDPDDYKQVVIENPTENSLIKSA